MTPLGIGVAPLWEGLVAGRSGVRPIRAFDPKDHTSKIAGEVPEFDHSAWLEGREARRLDRVSIIAIGAAHEALADAGVALREGGENEGGFVPDNVDPERFGCQFGSGIGGLATFEEQHRRLLERGPGRVSPFTIPRFMANAPAGEVSAHFGLKGPCSATVTACASASHSIGAAFENVRRGHADLMLTGGAEAAVTSYGVACFCALKALSTRNDAPEKASRPFDRERDGFVMAEGAAAIVLEDLGHARRRGVRVYAELVGFGASADAYHITAPVPDGSGAVRSMRAAMEDAGLAPEDVDYVNAHGTSTYYNDKVETLAIKKALGEDRARKVAVNSTKSMVGHSLGASGGIELIAVALSIRDGVVHPTVNQEVPDPDCDLDYVPNVARRMRVRAALSNSLGFGGHNATVAVGEFRD
jgi:3-oxoacyl-[acyl-carrier-protein] synthase II